MPIKIAVLAGDVSPAGGGVASAVTALYRALCEDGDFCVTLFGRNGDPSPQWPNLASVDIGGRGKFGYSPSLWSRLNGSAFDLLHVHGLWTYGSVVAQRWRRYRRPTMVSPHGMLDAWALAKSGWKKRIAGALFERRNIANATCIHALNPSEKAAVRSWGYKGPVAVIPNGVELPAVTARRQGGARTRTLLFLGRIDPKKSVLELIEAWSRLKSENRLAGWRLVLAGWGDEGYVGEVRRRIDELGASGSIAFVGPRFGEERAATYSGADAFILPSRSEGMPMTVLEAWSFGLPVLMSRECNLEIGFARKAAVPIATDPSALAEAIGLFLATTAEERRLLGAAGRHLVETEFTWQNAAARLADTYRWLLTNTGRPSCVDID